MRNAGQSEAKQFFVARILAQAAAEGVPFSTAERYMLSWSESDPHLTQQAALTAAFESETNETEFESKVARLIREAYTQDLRSHPTARESWREAYAALSGGDHYLLVMLRSALGWRLKRWFIF